MEVFLATGNPGKRFEFETLFKEVFDQLTVWDFSTWDVKIEPAVEDGDTFELNAFKKAHHVMDETGLMSFADDSGLVVDALDGAPGVFSARFAGVGASDDQNNAKLVESLKGIPVSDRTARYVAVICACAPGREPLYARGECEGVIIDEPRGEGGFGYDPYFLIPQWGLTTAEVTLEKKNTISHRAKALRELGELLVDADWI